MRVVRVRVSAFWLSMVFHGHGYSRVETDFPDDAEIIHAEWDGSLQHVVLNVTSEHFDDVPAGNVIPEWQPTITKHMKDNIAVTVLHRFRHPTKDINKCDCAARVWDTTLGETNDV